MAPHDGALVRRARDTFPGDGPRRVVVAHENITRRKELEREVVEIASLEQRRIGQDLHDSVSQELTALNMLAGDLAETLRTDPAKASQLVERLVAGIAAQPARASGRHARAASRLGRCRGAHGRTVRPRRPHPAGGQGDLHL